MARTADNFDLYQINPVKVSRRDGMNYVFNGQHTIEIVAAVSGSRETPVWCMVYDDMDYEVEADVFANQQKYVKTLSTYEIFQANVEAGNDEQTTIKSLVESYGLLLPPENSREASARCPRWNTFTRSTGTMCWTGRFDSASEHGKGNLTLWLPECSKE